MDPIILFEKSKQARKNILDIIYGSNSSHIGSSFSVIDILITIYNCIAGLKKIKNKDLDRDYVIFSKGHAASALYAALENVKLIDIDILKTYCLNGSKLLGHPVKGSVPGVEISSGSLGHGLPIAVGIAIVSKKNNYKNKVIAILSDGELNEGSVWEALNIAGKMKLDNLFIIVDCNKLQGFNRTDEITDINDYAFRFQSFGCGTVEINGHNFKEIEEALNKPTTLMNKPLVIIAHTVKGKGVSFMEDRLEWHYKSPDKEEYKQAEEEILDAKYFF